MGVKNVLVLRWSQRAHCFFCDRPKEPPKGAVSFENPESRLLIQHNQESVLKIVRGLGRIQAWDYSTTSAHKRLSKTESSRAETDIGFLYPVVLA